MSFLYFYCIVLYSSLFYDCFNKITRRSYWKTDSLAKFKVHFPFHIIFRFQIDLIITYVANCTPNTGIICDNFKLCEKEKSFLSLSGSQLDPQNITTKSISLPSECTASWDLTIINIYLVRIQFKNLDYQLYCYGYCYAVVRQPLRCVR